jgi:hypothetical protein
LQASLWGQREKEREREREREKEGGWEEERGGVGGAGGGARAQQQQKQQQEADGGRFGSSGKSDRTWSGWCKCFESEVEVKEGIEAAECKGRGRWMGCGGF